MLDLFSGIGGFSLAAKWVWGDDLDIVGFCEIEPYAQKVLKKNFPGVPIHEDIKKLRGDEFNEIDLITGGFPCQDISQAGKGAGIKEGTRSGLWFELLRVIGDIRPRFALIENVPMLTIRGGTGVIEDLTEIGYDTEWQIISAKDVGAWHLRKRIWIVAYPMCGREVQDTGEVSGTSPEIRRQHKSGQLNGRSSILANSNSGRNRRENGNLAGENGKESEGGETSADKPINGGQDISDTNKTRCHNNKASSRHRKQQLSHIFFGNNSSGDISNTNSRRLEGSGEEQGRTRDVVRGSGKGSQELSNANNVRCRDTLERQEEVRQPNSRNQSPERSANISNSNSNEYFVQRESRSRELAPQSDRGDIRARQNESCYWSTEPKLGRVANGVPSRVDRLKGIGNAIVPQVAALIMDRIKAID